MAAARSSHPLLAAFLLTVALHGVAAAQSITNSDRSRGRYMLGAVLEHLERDYYDPTFHGIDLRAAAARADSQIRAAQSNTAIFMIIAQFVQDLGDSHTRFYPPRRTAKFEYGWRLRMVGDSCYVVAVEPGSDAAAQGLAVGDRVVALDGYRPSRSHLHLLPYFLHFLSPRPVVRMEVASPGGAPRTLDVRSRVSARHRFTDLGALIREFENTERRRSDEAARVGDGIVVVRLGWFGDELDIDRAMGHARGAGALILDLRGNPGGLLVGLERLAAHVFDRRLTIATLRERKRTDSLESKPVGRPFAGRLYVLIDSESASAAEVFARIVQLEGRGMVIGDRSPGLVMVSTLRERSVGEGLRTFFALSLTEADLVMPDGSRLEGQGVIPDALVLAGAADLTTGRDPALALALRFAGHPMDPVEAGALLPRPEPDW